MSHWRRARLASRCHASIYIYTSNSSKFQSRCPIGDEHVLRVGATPVYVFIIPASFNQGVPWGKIGEEHVLRDDATPVGTSSKTTYSFLWHSAWTTIDAAATQARKALI